MKIEALMLANSGSHNGWLVDSQGAGWEHYSCSAYPCRVSGALIGVAVLEESDFGTDQQLFFKIENVDDGDILFLTDNTYHVGRRGPAVKGVPSRMPLAVAFEFDVTSPRVMRAVVVKDDRDLGEVVFAVKDEG